MIGTSRAPGLAPFWRPVRNSIVTCPYGSLHDRFSCGCTTALREAGRRIPEDGSVNGFDDIRSAAFQNPGRTTVRQPLREMGVLATKTLLRRITAPPSASY